MIFLVQNHDSNDPHLNLALEEFCLRKFASDRSLLLVYVNEPSVIIGRNQNILAEVNLPFAARMGLHIVRRISGGGAVYHDLGNLNFSFIQPQNRRSLKNIQQTLEPVRLSLQKMGAAAKFNAKNDLLVAGKKVSGNAQFSDTKRIMVHGTLLFNCDLQFLRRSLVPEVDLVSSRARKSIPSEVTNLSGRLSRRIGMNHFREMLLQTIAEKHRGLQDLTVSDRDRSDISRLAEEKYRSWEWNFGRTPAFHIRRSARTPDGYPETIIAVKSGRIAGIRFVEHIDGIDDSATLQRRLIGIPYHREAIRTRLSGADLRGFGLTLTANQLAEYLCDKGISGLDPGLQSA